MSKSIIYREFPISFTANGTHTINMLAETLAIIEVTGSLEMVLGQNPRTHVRAGMIIDAAKFENFKQVQFFETQGAPASIIVSLSNGGIQDNRLAVSGALDISKSSTIDPIPDITLAAGVATQIAPADANRRELAFTNRTGADMRYADAGVLVNSGDILEDGQKMILETTAAVFGFSTSGGLVTATTTGG